jgi:metallo-beta-lactamase class B
MKRISNTLFVVVLIISFTCSSRKETAFNAKEVYNSKELVITQLAENSFQHTSYLQTEDFGNVPCNGLIVRNGDEAIIYNTPTNDKSSEELINWVSKTIKCKINAVIPTHFHKDCLGGLQAFNDHNIPSYANFKTIELAQEKSLVVPKNGFQDSIVLKVGNEKTITKFFGEGHTIDNAVGYFPSEHILFGGCLLKELDATKGFLGDANVAEWSNTVEKIKKEYPQVKIIVPGHGQYGNSELFDYTIELFKAK